MGATVDGREDVEGEEEGEGGDAGDEAACERWGEGAGRPWTRGSRSAVREGRQEWGTGKRRSPSPTPPAVGDVAWRRLMRRRRRVQCGRFPALPATARGSEGTIGEAGQLGQRGAGSGRSGSSGPSAAAHWLPAPPSPPSPPPLLGLGEECACVSGAAVPQRRVGCGAARVPGRAAVAGRRRRWGGPAVDGGGEAAAQLRDGEREKRRRSRRGGDGVGRPPSDVGVLWRSGQR